MRTNRTVTDEQIRQAQAGDTDAMWDILSAYEPVLKSAVRSAVPNADREDAEDLLQEARVALMEHVRDYDTEGAKAQLHSYAFQAVRRAVVEANIKSTTALSVDPTTVIRVKRALASTGGDVEGAWMTVSTDPEPRHRMSREAFVSVCEALMETDSLDAPVSSGDSDLTWADVLPDTTADFVAPTESRDVARFLLGEIAPRQSFALRAFYGIGMMKTSDEQASDELGINSHRQCAALRQLRKNGTARARIVADAHNIAA
jgi:RNA polymerase primary sigma factor